MSRAGPAGRPAAAALSQPLLPPPLGHSGFSGCPRTHPAAPPSPLQVLHMQGPKWQLVWQLTQNPIWRNLMAGKRAVMVPDDDLQFDTCTINRHAWGSMGP